MRSLPHSKELDPTPQFKATAKLGEFLEARFLPVVLEHGGGAPGRMFEDKVVCQADHPCDV